METLARQRHRVLVVLSAIVLTILHSEQPKLHIVLAFVRAKGLS